MTKNPLETWTNDPRGEDSKTGHLGEPNDLGRLSDVAIRCLFNQSH